MTYNERQGLIALIIFVAFIIFAVVFSFSGCDTSDAATYKSLYASEVVANDTLRASINELNIRFKNCENNYDTLFNYVYFKLDSLKKNQFTLFQVDSAVASNIDTLLNYIEYGLEHLSDKAITYLDSIRKQ